MSCLRYLAASAAAALGATSSFAQGCAMCYTQASAQGGHAQRSLDYGILLLLVPSLLLFGGVLTILIRRSSA